MGGWNKGLTKYTNSSVKSISNSLLGHIPWNKGLTKEKDSRVALIAKKGALKKKWQIAWNKGIPCNDETKKKISKTLKNRYKNGELKSPFSNPHIMEKVKKKLAISNSTIEFRRKIRKARCKQIQKIKEKYGYDTIVQVGKYETLILNNIEKYIYPYKIQRQYNICGYFLDGYCKGLNLAFEIDELHHFNICNRLKEKDVIRQKQIESELNCKFIRIRVGDNYGII